MIVNKITNGYVIQQFDTDTQKFISQEFIAGDDHTYESEDGDFVDPKTMQIDGTEPYMPFEMLQPAPPKVNNNSGA